MQTQQLVVRIPVQQRANFEQLSLKEKITLSELVRRALDEYVAKRQDKFPGASLLELAKIGKKSKDPHGPENLSENYKKYLYKL